MPNILKQIASSLLRPLAHSYSDNKWLFFFLDGGTQILFIVLKLQT